ncbi:MAG: hypothetical protein EXR05_07140 [Acetobacteraceae bacterium]|nr:hypothetical protein [Acetobacteraceae bacterium]MSP30635.1 hypothetical protein [Acetobacteraceae bacterium]
MKLPTAMKPVLLGVVSGALAMAIAGFGFVGWKTGTNAVQMAKNQVSKALITAMVPFCVAKAHLDQDAGTMAKFRVESSSYARTKITQAAG